MNRTWCSDSQNLAKQEGELVLAVAGLWGWSIEQRQVLEIVPCLGTGLRVLADMT